MKTEKGSKEMQKCATNEVWCANKTNKVQSTTITAKQREHSPKNGGASEVEKKNCEIERKWVMFRDQNAKIKCDRQFMCVKKYWTKGTLWGNDTKTQSEMQDVNDMLNV